MTMVCARASRSAEHEGVVSFAAQSSGREAVMLGRVQVGEIAPVGSGVALTACYTLSLPESGSRAWRPAKDKAEAKARVIDLINDWLNATNLRPNGR